MTQLLVPHVCALCRVYKAWWEISEDDAEKQHVWLFKVWGEKTSKTRINLDSDAHQLYDPG